MLLPPPISLPQLCSCNVNYSRESIMLHRPDQFLEHHILPERQFPTANFRVFGIDNFKHVRLVDTSVFITVPEKFAVIGF